jgi:3-deoxy-D-manno-octulosonic-acid transferase
MKIYKKISYLIKPTLLHFDKILCQSQDNLDNFIQLGATNEQCQMSGNLKFDISINTSTTEKQAMLAELLPNKRTLWLVASTHQGDEAIALSAFNEIKKLFPQLLLVIVPRHPERFSTVAKLCISKGYSLAKRSENTLVIDHDIWLLDTLGELMAAYALADIVTMGGSFSHIGGHNPLEPALYKKPIIVGSDMSNFTDVMSQLQKNKGILTLSNNNQQGSSQLLSQAVLNLLNNSDTCSLLGVRAHQVVLNNQGASERTLAQVRELLS